MPSFRATALNYIREYFILIQQALNSWITPSPVALRQAVKTTDFYTSAGIGFGGLETTLVNKTDATVDAIISTSPNARNIGYGSLLAHTSLNISRVFGKSLLLGFKSGYNFGLGKHNWSADGNSGSQGTFSDTFNNFYLHMQVGLYVSR